MISNTKYVYMDETNISPFLLCRLCTKPYVDPVTTTGDDRYCRKCISQVISRSQNATNNDQQCSYGRTLTPITETIVLRMLDDLLVKCTQCGAVNIKRGKFDEHKATVCPQTIVPCRAADIKCPWTGAREELEDHLAKCIFQPLRPALADIVVENTQLKEKLEQHEAQIKELADKV